jgi:predicted transcriptional regulator
VAHVPEELGGIAEKVAQGEQPTATVRALLSWFWGSQRRGSFVKGAIRRALRATNLKTVPDFDATYLDGTITFMPEVSNDSAAKVEGVGAETRVGEIKVSVQDSMVFVDSVSARVKVDPSYRIARLRSAHTIPVSVGPDATISEAITLMLKQDFSQLPVMIGERTVKGLISWKSLGKRLALHKKCELVRDAMESVHVIDLDTSLFEASTLIATNDCVLVRDLNNKICGLMTPYDVSQTFVELGEAFLLLGEIENLIRDMLDGRFSKAELERVRDPLDAERPINDVSDLNFGGYVRLMQEPQAWERLQTTLDRGMFVGYLEKVRIIRNDTMHFDPDGIEDDELRELREFARLLKQLKEL